MLTRKPHIGVGALFNPSMYGFVDRFLHRLDYVAFIPDRGWIDKGVGSPHRFQMLPIAKALLDKMACEAPVVLHGIGLSICSAEIFDEEYARQLMDLADYLNSPWISEHLSFTRVGTGHEVNAAIPLPTPYDSEVLDLLIPRVQFFSQHRDRPFLLENNVYYVQYPGQEFSEEEFLNKLCGAGGCGVLLDLHNLYTNSVNHGFDAASYLSHLDLENVGEIHIAGGVPMMGFHTDSHTGPVLEPVWTLLEQTIPHTRNLRGITFEFHESSYGLLGESGILEQIDRVRAILSKSAVGEGSADVPAGISAGRC